MPLLERPLSRLSSGSSAAALPYRTVCRKFTQHEREEEIRDISCREGRVTFPATPAGAKLLARGERHDRTNTTIHSIGPDTRSLREARKPQRFRARPRVGYSQRTIQRDLLALDSELNVPLIYENRRWRIMEGANVVFGPVRLTLHESRAVYFATRLMLRSADERDPDGIAALEKIADALPARVASHMRRTVAEYSELPTNMQYIEVVRRLTGPGLPTTLHHLLPSASAAGSDEPSSTPPS